MTFSPTFKIASQSTVVIIQMFPQICLVIIQDTRIVVDALLQTQQ